ncbi:MAG: elongation factor P, partial [Bacteroidota bacterium]
MAKTSDIRKGLCIRHNNDIFTVVEFLHVKPGKGPAFVRTKLKSLTTGRVLDNIFRRSTRTSSILWPAGK